MTSASTDALGGEAATAVRWKAGDTVALRYITRPGQPGMAWPCFVVEDRDDLVALYIPRGTTYLNWRRDGSGTRVLVDDTWRRDVLRLMYPDRGYSIWLFWEGEERTFLRYYVNMEEPFRRTVIGFDTNDQALDIVVASDFSWQWKDAEQFDDRIANGIYTAAFGEAVWADAKALVARIEAREPPFCDGWESWAPPPAWALPSLPATCQQVPATLWALRGWAYGDA